MPKPGQNLPPRATALHPPAANLVSLQDAASSTVPAQQTARTKYQALHDRIVTTRETLPGDDTDNRAFLRDRAEEAQTVLTTLDRDDLQANTPAFTAAAAQIKQANDDMETLKDGIGGIVHDIRAVSDFIDIADQAISAATKFIG